MPNGFLQGEFKRRVVFEGLLVNVIVVSSIPLSYGVLTFGLVFVVQNMGGILQVTLTLNGLLGGVTLGLFALGIFFKSANSTVNS